MAKAHGDDIPTTYADSDILALFQKLLKARPKRFPIGAYAYCSQYMKRAVDTNMTGHSLHLQVLYVHDNMSSWTGVDAKRVRRELTDYHWYACIGCNDCWRGH